MVVDRSGGFDTQGLYKVIGYVTAVGVIQD
jgi:hypothetical protein